ncbi:MAG: glucose/arabinose dehydrogenase [Verrucomicrobiales bacterium]|jgi:glucose/arabinose dehydrogenase
MKNFKYTGHALALVVTFALGICAMKAAPPRLKLVPVAERAFVSPVAIAHAGDGSYRLFIVDQRGTVQVMTADGTILPDPFLDVSAKLVPERDGFDERGLLSIAFHPNFQENGKLYAYYSARSPSAPGTDEAPVDHQSIVAEFSISEDANHVDPDSERILLTIQQPQFNHDGGQLAFGPDGFLHISTGDGGGADDNDAGHTGGSTDKPDGGLGNAQDLTRLLGKILRIDPSGTSAPGGEYAIPEDNPFALQDDAARDEIFAYGLRNPWRFSFDRATGQLFCADVGQGEVEEINLIEAGMNYGWRKFEGTRDFDPTAMTSGEEFEAPIGQYAHPESNIPGLLNIGVSVTGGYVYRGTAIPDLIGTYVFGDWTASFSDPSGTILALEPTEENQFVLSIVDLEGSDNPLNAFIPTFGEDESGELYVATKTTLAASANDPVSGMPTGTIYRIEKADGGGTVTETMTLEPSANASLFEEEEILGNGAGIYLFSGHTAGINDGLERRALLKFDVVGNVPAGATIDDASVSLRMNKIPRSGAVASNFGLHPLTRDWVEGTANARGNEGKGIDTDDGATWLSTALNAGPQWEAPGGDFSATASAITNIASRRQRYDWSGEGLAADVQKWLDDAASNFGWMLFSDSDREASARRFDSRHATNVDNRPTLTITYSISVGTPGHRDSWLQQFYPNGDYPGDDSDQDGDQLAALLEYGLGTDPTQQNFPSEFIQPQNAPAPGTFAVSFVRDPRAVDLTYTLQAGDNLNAWTDVATSVAGATTVAQGEASVVEEAIAAREPFAEVNVTVPGDAAAVYFRLLIYREL